MVLDEQLSALKEETVIETIRRSLYPICLRTN
ncbi:MAG: hypothetical protein KME32_09175 [Mojavia pulchra JT2-VF2]|uniref:Uncharacterized protein n=1 Tax=Mojavia pulchra JT2-VF2 TaxID=287848 RepID=A0A951UFM9_9NOST|nr:hypothetical protein [Mojavia pulchra JT2-VF2]